MGPARVSLKYQKIKTEEHPERTVRGFLLLSSSTKANTKCSSTVCMVFSPCQKQSALRGWTQGCCGSLTEWALPGGHGGLCPAEQLFPQSGEDCGPCYHLPWSRNHGPVGHPLIPFLYVIANEDASFQFITEVQIPKGHEGFFLKLFLRKGFAGAKLSLSCVCAVLSPGKV